MKKSYSFATLTVILWSTIATISKVLLNNLDVMFVLAATSVIATAATFVSIYSIAGIIMIIGGSGIQIRESKKIQKNYDDK